MYHKVAFWVSVASAIMGVIVASMGAWWGVLQAIVCAVLAYLAYNAKRKGEPVPLSKEWHEKEKKEWEEKVGMRIVKRIVKWDTEEGVRALAQAKDNLKSQGKTLTDENIEKEALRILFDKNEEKDLANS